MGSMASQIDSLAIVFSIVHSGAELQIKENIKAPRRCMASVWGIHRWPVNSPHKGPATRKVFSIDDVIMDVYQIIILIMGSIRQRSHGDKNLKRTTDNYDKYGPTSNTFYKTRYTVKLFDTKGRIWIFPYGVGVIKESIPFPFRTITSLIPHFIYWKNIFSLVNVNRGRPCLELIVFHTLHNLIGDWNCLILCLMDCLGHNHCFYLKGHLALGQVYQPPRSYIHRKTYQLYSYWCFQE